MSEERPTIRPVTLARLVETAQICQNTPQTTEHVEQRLDVSHRRARETILESLRVNLVEEAPDDKYESTPVGSSFVEAVENQDWNRVSSILEINSPHYSEFLQVLKKEGPAHLDSVLFELEKHSESTPYSYNQTSIEIVGNWGKCLGTVQRNAFTGEYYRLQNDSPPENFHQTLLNVYDKLEETAGVGLRQRYLSIPELRESVCATLQLSRQGFDNALRLLAQKNVGKIELSGAPRDTGAKEANFGIKEISLSDDETLVSTSQSTEKVMQGIEQHGKQYYYLTVHDRELTYIKQ
jgi:hypothetical protein